MKILRRASFFVFVALGLSAFILLCGLAAHGDNIAVVYGKVQSATGGGVSTGSTWTPLLTPLDNGDGSTTLSNPFFVSADTNGFFGATNIPSGIYDVDFGSPNKSIRIIVESTNTYNFNYCANLAKDFSTVLSTAKTFGQISKHIFPGANVTGYTNNVGTSAESLIFSVDSSSVTTNNFEQGDNITIESGTGGKVKISATGLGLALILEDQHGTNAVLNLEP